MKTKINFFLLYFIPSLKKRADYSSCDATNLNGFLSNLGNEYSVYTYDMLNAGIDRDTLMSINEEQLLCECGIKNKIHRIKIQQGVVFICSSLIPIKKTIKWNLSRFQIWW